MTTFVFEGLPGSGKTMLTKDLSKKLGVPRIGEIINKDFNELLPGEVGIVKQSFFLNSDKRKYFLAKKYAFSKIVVMDRGYLSTIAYNLCLGNNAETISKTEKRLSKVYQDGCIHVYIKINPKISILRKNKTPNDSRDMWSFLDNLRKTSKFYNDRLKGSKNSFIIDGSLPYKKVYSLIKNLIISYETNKKDHLNKYQ
jgi:thymidylate kinase